MLLERTSRTLVLIFWGLLLARVAGLCQQSEPIAQGKVIPKVICAGDPQQSYALYLPSGYTATRKWPVLFAFDPGARGKVPVELFKEPAEKYGYVVAGSNNSRNGPFEPILAAVNAMVRDVMQRYSVNEQRLYTTGFSGGGGVAVSVGCAGTRAIAGVIACGCPFQELLNRKQTRPFVFFGTAGFEDFNYPALRQIGQLLDSMRIPNRVRIFEGGHEWPPPAVAFEAIEWMELQAMKSGQRSQDAALIEKLLQKETDRIRSLENSGQAYQAYLDRAAMTATFHGLRDTTELSGHAGRLKNSREVAEGAKKDRQQIEQQERFRQEMGRWIPQLQEAETRQEALSSILSWIAFQKKQAATGKSNSQQVVARRCLTDVFVSLYYQAQESLDIKQYGQAAVWLTIQTEIRPENAQLWFRLACARAMNKERKKSLEALKTAVAKGFADLESLRKTPELASLRESAEYKAIQQDLLLNASHKME